MRCSVFLLFLWAPVLCAAAQSHPCSGIEDASERLACFDALFPDATVEAASDSDPVAQGAEKVPVPSESVVVTAGPASEPVPTDAPASTPRESTWIGDEKVNFTSGIRAIRVEEKQPMIFLLENEQIWMQSSARALPFAKGDRVTVKNALLGGYFMHSEKGASTRVQRIH